MRSFVCALFLITLQMAASGQGIVLTAGQSYVLTFDSISYSGPYIPPSGTLGDPGPPSNQSDSAFIFFARNELDDGTSELIWEIFPGDLTTTPITEQIVGASYAVPPEDPVVHGVALRSGPTAAPFFPNLQGAFRVTMLNGTAEVSGFSVSQIVGDSFYSQSFPAPEPSPATLIGIGLAIHLIGRCGKREQPTPS
jgi:hypothetical protein